MKVLIEKGQKTAATEAVETLFAKPSLNPEVFVWVCKQILEAKWDPSMFDVPRAYLLVCLLDFLEEIETEIAADDESPDLRGAASKARALLMADGHDHICQIIRDVTTGEARHFLASVKAHKTLNDTYKLSIEAALRNIRSDFEDALASAAASGAHFVTAEALQRTQEEYLRIKSVEIPANSKAIGEAAALGDLSENADYDAAKQHQKALFARVEELHDLLTRARPFNVEAIRTDKVGPGTRITARNLTDNRDETYTLLGIWDADLENGVLSYSSPFASQFIGKTKGERIEVTTPAGEAFDYTVLTIENALASSASE
jgi:transcription elongation factor GreA